MTAATDPIVIENAARFQTSSSICTAQVAAFGKRTSYGVTTILSNMAALRFAANCRLFTHFV